MSKEQRVTFTIKRNTSGLLSIGMDFYPRLAKSQQEFEALPLHIRENQNAAADIGKAVIKAMNEHNEKARANAK